jgi:hypothetical protein
VKHAIFALFFACLALSSALAQDPFPNVSGIYSCSGQCRSPHRRPYILQTGNLLLCFNEAGGETSGELYWFQVGTTENPNNGMWWTTCWGSRVANGNPSGGGTFRMNRDGSVGTPNGALYIDWQTPTGSTPVLWTQNPSSVSVPNFSGHFSCTGNCHGATTLVQNGADVLCINDSNRSTDAHGTITGRRTLDGCWGLHATVSEDMTQINWGNGSIWIRT